MPRAQNRADESRHRRRSRCCWPHRLSASHRPRRSRARHRGRARAARRASIWAPLMTVIPCLMSAPRGTSTATAPKPRLLDSCAAAVYAAAATPSRDPRRPVCRALLPSLPALLDRMLTIYMPPRRPPRGPRPSSRPRRGCPPRVHSARLRREPWSARKAPSPRHRCYRSPPLYLLLSPRAEPLGAAPAAPLHASQPKLKQKTTRQAVPNRHAERQRPQALSARY